MLPCWNDLNRQRERDWNVEKMYVGVPIFLFSLFAAAQDALPTQHVCIWLGMRLNNQLSLWCIQEQLGQILLILPLTLIVFEFC